VAAKVLGFAGLRFNCTALPTVVIHHVSRLSLNSCINNHPSGLGGHSFNHGGLEIQKPNEKLKTIQKYAKNNLYESKEYHSSIN
jgi:hypothetical protein